MRRIGQVIVLLMRFVASSRVVVSLRFGSRQVLVGKAMEVPHSQSVVEPCLGLCLSYL